MTDPLLIRVLNGEIASPPPAWLMRQAGRYLPEYRALRETSKGFVDYCLTPELATEATLQPMRRFADLDAAILFADILLIPFAAGAGVRFVAGEGPVMNPVASIAEIEALTWNAVAESLAPVSETVRRVRAALPADKALIGFAGAPWTVATYMIGGGKDPNRWAARTLAWKDPAAVDLLLTRLVDATVSYLVSQAEAGAQVLQIFDSWAEQLPAPLFDRVVVRPTRAIVDGVRAAGVAAPILGFPRGCGHLADVYARETGVTALALDMSQADAELVRRLPAAMPVQGGFDPALLAAGGAAMADEVSRLLTVADGRPYVFNLGHGVSPDIPIDHVAELLAIVKDR